MTPDERTAAIIELSQIRFEIVTSPRNSAWEADATTQRCVRLAEIQRDLAERFGDDVLLDIHTAYRGKSDELLVAAGWEVDPYQNCWRKKQA